MPSGRVDVAEWAGQTFEPIPIPGEEWRVKRPTGTVEQEQRAATYWCRNHGTCTAEMVTTKKVCLWCNTGLDRHAGYPEDLPWLAALSDVGVSSADSPIGPQRDVSHRQDWCVGGSKHPETELTD